MAVDDLLITEARIRARFAALAAASGVVLVVAAVLQLAGPQSSVSELTVQLITIHKRFPLDVLAATVNGLGLLGLVATMGFLFAVTRARKPQLVTATRTALAAGGIVTAFGGIVFAAILAAKANQFVNHGTQTYLQAHQLTKGATLPVLQTVDIAASFALAIGIVLISLNAMRVGLLTRFMGYFGILVGVAGMLLIGSPPAAALQIFWLFGLAYLFSGRWAGGDPPSWRTGKIEPWPTSAELREQRTRASGAGNGRAKTPPRPAPETVGAPTARTRSNTPKRKRKRRR